MHDRDLDRTRRDFKGTDAPIYICTYVHTYIYGIRIGGRTSQSGVQIHWYAEAYDIASATVSFHETISNTLLNASIPIQTDEQTDEQTKQTNILSTNRADTSLVEFCASQLTETRYPDEGRNLLAVFHFRAK